MTTVDIAGIATHYEVSGSGSPKSPPPDRTQERLLAFLAAHAGQGLA